MQKHNVILLFTPHPSTVSHNIQPDHFLHNSANRQPICICLCKLVLFVTKTIFNVIYIYFFLRRIKPGKGFSVVTICCRNSPIELVIVTVYDCWGHLNSSFTSASGCRDMEERQEVWVSFASLTVHTVHSAEGSLVDTSTVEPLFGRTTVCKDSEETNSIKKKKKKI